MSAYLCCFGSRLSKIQRDKARSDDKPLRAVVGGDASSGTGSSSTAEHDPPLRTTSEAGAVNEYTAAAESLSGTATPTTSTSVNASATNSPDQDHSDQYEVDTNVTIFSEVDTKMAILTEDDRNLSILAEAVSESVESNFKETDLPTAQSKLCFDEELALPRTKSRSKKDDSPSDADYKQHSEDMQSMNPLQSLTNRSSRSDVSLHYIYIYICPVIRLLIHGLPVLLQSEKTQHQIEQSQHFSKLGSAFLTTSNILDNKRRSRGLSPLKTDR